MTIRKLFHPRSIACAVLMICLTGMLIPSEMTHAQRKYFKEEWADSLPDFYPRGFHGYGRIDRITLREVVIDDVFFNLTRHVRFSTPRSRSAPLSSFGVGRLVGYILNDRREVESLWLIE